MKFIVLIFLLCLSCSDSKKQFNEKDIVALSQNQEKTKSKNRIKIKAEELEFTYEVFDEFPHDESAYTQGLIYYNDYLYESTGQYGKSTLRKVNPKTGKIENKTNVGFIYFAEGIEIYNDKIFLITWKNNICKVYDLKTFSEIDEKRYSGEGWGLCFAGNNFYLSNGSNVIQIMDKETFLPTDQFSLFNNNGFPLDDINELEFAKGYIFANLWMKDKIAIIDINSRSLIKIMDFSKLREKLGNKRNAEVMNGIAYDEVEDVFYLTGKNWDKVFKVKIK